MNSIQITGIAFTAMSSNIIDRTTDELRNEQIITNSTKEISSNIGYMTKEKSNLVAFNDPVSGEIAVVSLSSTTMDKLKAHFGENDFFKREDGITRLDNKAEAFVGGWFGDIAYKREFLSADQNQDGKLDSNEYSDTKNGFLHHGQVFGTKDSHHISTGINNDKTYQYSNNKRKNFIDEIEDKSDISIDKQLNKTLKDDKNFNGKIEFAEILTDKYKKNVKESVVQLAKDMLGDDLKGFSIYEEIVSSITESLDKLNEEIERQIDNILTKALDENITQKSEMTANMRDEQSKKTSAIGTLIQNGGDVNKLTQEDKALIKDEIEHSKSSDGNIDIDKLKHIQEHQRAKENYTAVDIQTPKLYVQKG